MLTPAPAYGRPGNALPGSVVALPLPPSAPTPPSAAAPLLDDLLLLVQGMEAAVFVIDQDERYLRVVAGRFPLLAPPELLLGQQMAELLPADVLDLVRPAMQAAQQSGEEALVRYDLTLPGPHGEVRHFEARFVRRPAGGVLVAVFDITDRVRADVQRRARERHFQALIERSSDVLYALDRDLRITMWSPGAERALGWSTAEALGQPGLDYIHPEDRERIVPPRLHGPSGTSEVRQFRVRHRDGSYRDLDAIVRDLLDDPDIAGIVVNAQDVTEQRRMEARAAEAQKLESIGRMAGGIAHDFNNLLTVIMGCGDMLQQAIQTGRPPDPVDVDEILAASRRARELTTQLLAFARRQIVSPSPVDLDGFLRHDARVLQRFLGEDLLLRVDPAPGPRWTCIDPSQLHQIVLHLAINAREAMPLGGELRLATDRVQISQDEADQAEGLKAGAYVCLRVKDQGPGIPPEVREHLFEPFFTTKAMGRGTGMGLATVYGIARQNGGAVRVESAPGLGSTFVVLLPERLPEGAPRVGAGGSPPTSGPKTVLVVDDDPSVASIAARALREGGYRVLLAHDGPSALALAAETPDLDLLLTDVVMPGMSGRLLAEHLLVQRPGLPVIFMSGYPHDGGMDDSGSEPPSSPGQLNLLPKPFTPPDLLARVRDALVRTPPSA